jgi:uroporphyrinogen-III synthase
MRGQKIANIAAQPLVGVRVLVGRARHQAGALSGELRRAGAQVIEIPFIEIRRPRSFQALDSAVKNIDSYDWLILTSVNGVEAMWARMRKVRRTHLDRARLQIAAIGPATKKAIEQRGANVDVVPKEYVAESVVQSLRKKVKGKRVLLVRAKVARDVIPRELRRAGAKVDVVEAYETIVPRTSRTLLRAVLRNSSRRPHIITFTSSSTASNFVNLLGRSTSTALDGILMSSIGPVTSATLRELGLRADIRAREFTIPGLVTAIRKAWAARIAARSHASSNLKKTARTRH